MSSARKISPLSFPCGSFTPPASLRFQNLALAPLAVPLPDLGGGVSSINASREETFLRVRPGVGPFS